MANKKSMRQRLVFLIFFDRLPVIQFINVNTYRVSHPVGVTRKVKLNFILFHLHLRQRTLAIQIDYYIKIHSIEGENAKCFVRSFKSAVVKFQLALISIK